MSSSKLSWISALTRFRSSLIGACLSALGLFALMGQLPLIGALAKTKRRRCATLQRSVRQFCDRAVVVIRIGAKPKGKIGFDFAWRGRFKGAVGALRQALETALDSSGRDRPILRRRAGTTR